ncbi:MAG: Glycosyltransferase involved in cell wall bisynthesis [Chloroflexi bacterium AL-W]|nr:Glycosyltransferase involved in cell wall bisynthesis [Chloroflexi bacterium AL-N1]NOK69285.1 Glycosyltransferase involved in cell wall bisynthesis [Chloroflexi bacterium AL-N10]NOK76346.1 Glycosyltransferase involved in cell wall bisynthesis [Chloroflexi bacterium AL-N5]NOK83463.1 Glycosyltransferase involved in cell wall bisynthesis [Chloroflexi bacterium AL-W]NOK91123.1 Glycosyltransferase involved in cell wall bisynthesis [Chloroflexi bacterium AL-N15]
MTKKQDNSDSRETMTHTSKQETHSPIKVYPLPPQLLTSPYLDQLYTHMQETSIDIRRLRPRHAIPELLLGRGKRILHLHFFDELTQHLRQWQTILRSCGFLAILLLLRLRGVHVLWTAHNIQPHELHHPFWGFLVYRLVIRWSTSVIAHSHAAKDMLEARYGPLNHCTIIPHGSYVNMYGPLRDQSASRTQLNLPNAQPVFLNFGTLRPYKNLEMLIDAFAKLPVTARGTLLIIGAAKDQDYASALQERTHTVQNVIVRNQFIPDDELPQYLAAADAIVLPYRTMLTSGILWWAMSYARPVVAPAFGPVTELIHEGHEGFLFTPGNTDSLRAALARLLSNPDLSSMGAASLKVAQQFAWPQIAAQTTQLYQDIVRET